MLRLYTLARIIMYSLVLLSKRLDDKNSLEIENSFFASLNK